MIRGSSRWRRSAFWKASAALHAGVGLGVAIVPSGWALAAGAVAANHLALALAGMIPRSSLLGPNLTRLPAESAPGGVALSFDDGPDPETTPSVLERLESHGARASFFCVGRHVERHSWLVREICDRGHEVENHTYHHAHSFGLLGPARLREEVVRAQDAIERAAGRRPQLFRAPAGIRNLFLDPVLERLELRLVSWTRRGYDTVSRSPRRVAARLEAGLRAGDILVLHDGPPVRRGRGAPVALEALSHLLDALASRGLHSLPIAEALRGARA